MRKTIVMILCVIGSLSACATKPATEINWVKEGVQEQQKVIDTQVCTANAYRTAGPRPHLQSAPACTAGFACGMAKGQVAASNGLAMESWNAAFQTGFDSCMYEKGYLQSNN